MTILEVLRDDHKQVSELLNTISRTRTAKPREKHFVEVKQMVEMHSYLEQLIFYRALLSFTENQDLIQHAQEEHQHITELMAELDSLAKEDREWMPKFRALKEAIKNHVAEEEGKVFDRARKSLSPERLNQLGAEMVTKKAEQLAVQ